MKKQKMCGCGKPATYETTIKRTYCDSCGLFLVIQERELSKHQKIIREKPDTEK